MRAVHKPITGTIRGVSSTEHAARSARAAAIRNICTAGSSHDDVDRALMRTG